MQPYDQVKISLANRALEHLRPDRMDRLSIHEDFDMDADYDYDEHQGADQIAQEFEDYLENDDPLMEEAYDIS